MKHELEPGHVYFIGDARNELTKFRDGSVDLVVTSPPYNAGKTYEFYDDKQEWNKYFDLLADVFNGCYRVLRSGGRLCVNVAGVYRTPYIPIQAHLTQKLIEQGYLMRGEIIWHKKVSRISTAWGSWLSPKNPTLRDDHEYILVFSKERYDLTRTGKPDITKEEFLACTKTIWEFPAESAKRVEHPAPFPIELPTRLIKLYTYPGNVVLDPFCGVGTTMVAAKMLGRKSIGIDLDPAYMEKTQRRMAQSAG